MQLLVGQKYRPNQMRISIITISIFLLFGFSTGKPAKQLLGRWEVVKMVRKDKIAEENMEKYIVFNNDGTLEGGKIGKEPNKFGHWEFKKESNNLVLNIEGGSNRDNGEYQIIALSKKKMELMKDSTFIYLEKMKKNKK